MDGGVNTAQPRVSVLMLTYRQEAYVDRAIASVIRQQTPFGVEIIIGDDCSPDRTPDRLRRWQQRYPERIRLLESPENQGLARNFMRTFGEARGEYIAICEGDDFWISRHKLARQVAWLDAHRDCSLCYHRVVNYYEADGSKSLSAGGRARRVTLADLARMNPITNVSVVYRRSCIPQPLPGWIEGVKSYDLVMHCLCAERGYIYYMPRVMAVYRKLGTSIWTGGDRRRQSEISRVGRDLLIAYFRGRREDIVTLLRQSNAENCLALALYLRTQGKEAEALEAERQAQAYCPEWTGEETRRRQHALEARSRRPGPLRRAMTALRKGLTRLIPI